MASMKKQKQLIKKIITVLLATIIACGCFFICGCQKNDEPLSENDALANYEKAVGLMEAGDYEKAAKIFKTLGNWRDSGKYYQQCETAIKKDKYERGMKLLESGDESGAYKLLAPIDYNDSAAVCGEIIKEKPDLAKAGDIIIFGKYEQDAVTENGAEPLKWLILNVKYGKIMMITLDIIDARDFNKSKESVTWENCELRTWLNNDFIATAFSDDERSKIQLTEVRASENPGNHKIDPGNDSEDKIFLLSISEATVYFLEDSDRSARCSEYAIQNGCYSNTNQYGWWRLRTPGTREGCYADVNSDGTIFSMGIGTYAKCSGVRPAMWIKL